MEDNTPKHHSDNDVETDSKDNQNSNQLDKLFNDFINDLKLTFPELNETFLSFYKEDGKLDMNVLLKHTQKIYPERFFDILYKNDDIFQDESNVDTRFLPNIEFKTLWNLDGVSDNTKETIWKYLQLIVFSVIGSVEDKSLFGRRKII